MKGLSSLTLDLGCGYRKRGDVNIDIRKKVKPTVIADVHYIPFKNRTFDVICCFEVIEHVISPFKLLSESYRVLRDTGKFILSTPNPYFWRKIAKTILFGRAYAARDHISTFTMPVIENLFKKIGLIIESMNYSETPWASVYFKNNKFKDSVIPIRALGMRQLLVTAHTRENDHIARAQPLRSIDPR